MLDHGAVGRHELIDTSKMSGHSYGPERNARCALRSQSLSHEPMTTGYKIRHERHACTTEFALNTGHFSAKIHDASAIRRGALSCGFLRLFAAKAWLAIFAKNAP